MSKQTLETLPSIAELADAIKKRTDRVRSNVPRTEEKRCGACQKEGDLFLLPLRYGVAGKQTGIPALPLAENIACKMNTTPLQTTFYTVQMLRQGYLYVLEERSNESRWRAFTVSEEGCLYESASTPEHLPIAPPTFSCDVTTHGVMAAFLHFQNSAEITALYLLFCPDKMTKKRLEFYQHDGRHKLQKITRAQLMSQQSGTAENALPRIKPDRLTQQVLEFHLAEKALQAGIVPAWFDLNLQTMAVKALLGNVVAYRDEESCNRPYSEQRYSVPRLRQTAARYPKLITELQALNGMAVVLEDAIGITQSLTSWRNAALEDELKPWLEQQDHQGITNEHRLMVYQKVEDIKQKLGEMKVAALLAKKIDNSVRGSINRKTVYFTGGGMAYDPRINMEESDWLALLERIEKQEKAALEAAFTPEKIAAEKAAFQKKYWNRIEPAMHAFKQMFDEKCRVAEAKAERRAQDVITWLRHPALIAALEQYDQQDLTNGVFFSAQTGQCLLGLETSEAGRQLIDLWWHDLTMPASNLCWRSLLYNNATAINRTKEIAALGEQQSSLQLPFSTAQIEIFESLYEFADKALEQAEKLNHNQQLLNGKNVGLLVWFGTHFRHVLKVSLFPSVDKKMVFLIKGLAHRGLEKISFDLKLEDIGKRAVARAAVSSKTIKQNITSTLSTELSLGQAGMFYRLRDAMNKAVIQSVLLFLKGNESLEKGDKRQYLEFISAGLVVAAVGIELVASSMEIVMERTATKKTTQTHGSLTYRSAATYHSKMKVWAGAFSTTAGVMLVGYDYADAASMYKNGNTFFSIAYAGRGTAVLMLTAGEFMQSLVAGQLYFHYLVKHGKSSIVRRFGRFGYAIGNHLAKALSGKIMVGLTLRCCVALMRFVPVLGWVTLTASVLFMFFGPDELDEWLDDCCFSEQASNRNTIKSLAEELTRLDAAVKGVIE